MAERSDGPNAMDWNLNRLKLDDEIADEDAELLELLDDLVSPESARQRKTYLDVIAANTKKLRSRPARPATRPPLHHCHGVICQRRVLLSTRLHKLGDLNAALCADRDAVAADPGCDLGWLQRGVTEYGLKRYTDARSSFAHVLQLAGGVEYQVAGRGGSYVSSVEPAVVARARAMMQRLDELEAKQQAELSANKQSELDAKVRRKKKMRARSVRWDVHNKEGMAAVTRTDRLLRDSQGAAQGDAYGFVRQQDLVNPAATSSTAGPKQHGDEGTKTVPRV
eukprot:COSAG02_NODE_1185_length_14007_cov_52.908398_3_plen_280_part_00